MGNGDLEDWERSSEEKFLAEMGFCLEDEEDESRLPDWKSSLNRLSFHGGVIFKMFVLVTIKFTYRVTV